MKVEKVFSVNTTSKLKEHGVTELEGLITLVFRGAFKLSTSLGVPDDRISLTRTNVDEIKSVFTKLMLDDEFRKGALEDD